MSPERLRPTSQEPTEKPKRRSGNVGGRFDAKPTVYTKEDPRYGEILLRVEPGTELNLSPVQEAKFIEDALRVAELKGQADAITKELMAKGGPYEGFINAIEKNKGLTGIIATSKDLTVTGVTDTTLDPKPEFKEETGEAFSTLGVEEVGILVKIPEGSMGRSGRPITVEEIINAEILALMFVGLDEETQGKVVTKSRRIIIKDKDSVLRLIEEGKISGELAGKQTKLRVVVDKVQKTPKPRAKKNGNGK